MYKNYGDVNFFDYGRMAEVQKDGTIDVLVCNPVFDCKNPDRCYQFDRVNVDINDSWIDVDAVCNYADTSKDDTIQFALACIEYYGVENFGGTAYYTEEQFNTKSEILDSLRYYNIEEVDA
jgi:hypothetical protein